MKEGLDSKSKLELANLLLQIGFREEAIAELLAAAAVLREMGENQEAITIYRRVLDLEPENWTAIRGLEELAPGPPTRRVEEIVSRLGMEEVKREPAKPPAEVKPTPVPTESLETPTVIRPEPAPPPPEETAPAEDPNQLWNDFKAKIEEPAEQPDKRLALGERFLESGMLAEAQTQLELAHTLKKTAGTIEPLATCLIKKGDYPKAMSLVKEGLRAPFPETEKLSLHYLLGTIYRNLDDSHRALEEFSQISKLAPDYRNVQELIALLGGAPPAATAPPEMAVPPKEETPPREVTAPSQEKEPQAETVPPVEAAPTKELQNAPSEVISEPPVPTPKEEPVPAVTAPTVTAPAEQAPPAPVIEERFPVIEEPLPSVALEEPKPEELPPLLSEENIAFL